MIFIDSSEYVRYFNSEVSFKIHQRKSQRLSQNKRLVESEKEIWCTMKISIVQMIKVKNITGKQLTSEINVDSNVYGKY